VCLFLATKGYSPVPNLSKLLQVDGSNLPFREKMRLFAAQLGEQTPKDRLKASSAQRGIEIANENYNDY